ncbi:hypothetical protein F3Y22_tig00111191pilonHSYRG00206 [Hibiscus syriacus]|uniref:Cytochrome P450 n=1 Tax=Hibiscus syriacus TaxID=106335 RepID=A0A6A2YWR4_HIBSY|nr:hypothetical protein F3Y22_tig00111191pilonHSYRG00206 [Hibiscus syriacus]
MVIKESLSLHPVAPLLIPHESTEDITVNGYFIPKKSRIMVNAWSMGRDRKVWSDNTEEFFPERFEDSSIDLRGHDFQFIPFGAGRRGCPAMQLGLTTMRLIIAQLVHCFDWELPDAMLPNEIDMTEKFGLTVPRAKHLHKCAICEIEFPPLYNPFLLASHQKMSKAPAKKRETGLGREASYYFIRDGRQGENASKERKGFND